MTFLLEKTIDGRDDELINQQEVLDDMEPWNFMTFHILGM